MSKLKQFLFKEKFIFLYLLPGLGMVGYSLFAPVLPLFARRLGASGFEVGLLTSGFMVARGLSAFFTGKLIDRSGKRRIFISLGFFFVIFVMLALCFSDHYIHLFYIRFTLGLLSGLVWPSAQVLVVENSRKDFRTRALSLYQISGKVGVLISRMILSVILIITANLNFPEIKSFRIVFIVSTIVLFICFLETLFIPCPPVKTKKKHLGKPPYSILFLGFVIGAMFSLNPITFVFLNEFFEVDTSELAILLLVIDFLGIFAVFGVSHLSDKYGFRKVIWVVLIPLFTAGILMPYLKTYYLFLVGYIIIRVFLGAFTPLARASVAMANSNTGANLGALNMTTNFGSVTGPIIAGIIFDQFSGHFKIASYAIIALLFIPAVIIYLKITIKDKL